MTPNLELKDQALTALRSHLGRYRLNGADRGLAFHSVNKSFALVNEGLPAGTEAEGLEAIMALYPDPQYNAQHEMGDEGMSGILYYSCTLKAWTESVLPAYEALTLAFPLMTLRSHRQPRQVPSDLNEVLTAWVPWQA